LGKLVVGLIRNLSELVIREVGLVLDLCEFVLILIDLGKVIVVLGVLLFDLGELVVYELEVFRSDSLGLADDCNDGGGKERKLHGGCIQFLFLFILLTVMDYLPKQTAQKLIT